MLVVIAIGGRALQRRGEVMSADVLRTHARSAAKALAPIAAAHQLVVVHGSGPQMGLLALQGAAYAQVETYPLDIVGAQTECMFTYMVEQELGSLLGPERPFATMLTMVEVDPDDPAFRNPNRFTGPVYLRDEAERLAQTKGWVFQPDGDKWRRVVACPDPKRIFELRALQSLLERNTVVIAAGGGGVPAVCEKGRSRRVVGSECVIDPDLFAGLLARELSADLFVMVTGAEAVYVDWATPNQCAIRRASPSAMSAFRFPAASMVPKVEAACRFATATGARAAVGTLSDLEKIVAGRAGTTISVAEEGIVYDADAAPLADAAVRR